VLSSEFFVSGLRDELSQGDIIEFCVTGALPATRVARTWDGQTGPEQKATVFQYPTPANIRLRRPPNPPLFGKGGPEGVLLEGRLSRSIIVSDDCVALAKAKNQAASGLQLTERQRSAPWHLVPLGDWPSAGEFVQIDGSGVSLGSLITAGRVKRYLEIPEFCDPDGRVIVRHCKADFRFLTPVKPEALEGVTRLASISDSGQRILWAKVLTYFSGKELPHSVTCPHCAKTFPSVEALF
jgi:hypothetical protein